MQTKNGMVSVLLLLVMFLLPSTCFATTFVNPLPEEYMSAISQDYMAQNSWDNGGHGGIDFAVPSGTPVFAVADGIATVHLSDPDGFGICVYIEHADGIFSLYGHLSQYLFESGAGVHAGQTIALSGNSGHSTGDHLHFQMARGGPFKGNGTLLNPHDYIFSLPAYAGPGYGQMTPKMKAQFDATVDLAKPIKEFIDTFGTVATKALQILTTIGTKLIAGLFVIDFALGACFRMLDPFGKSSSGNFFTWLVFKILFYMLMLVFMLNWGDWVGNFSKTMFLSFGGMAFDGSTDAVAAGKAISDPFNILQKGAEIITPLINHCLSAHVNPLHPFQSIGIFLLVLLFSVILFILFAAIVYQIALTYMEFYVAVLFGFSTFIFAGVKQGREFASRGLNGIFSASLKLFFFSMFSLMLQNIMSTIQVDEFFSNKTQVATPIYGETGTNGIINDMGSLMLHIMAKESSGDPHADNGTHHGYFQIADSRISFNNWNRWCHEYEDTWAGSNDPEFDMGHLDTEPETDPPPSHPEPPSDFPWTRHNQYAVAHMQMLYYFKEAQEKGWDDAKCYEAVAAAWHYGHVGEDTIADNKDYWYDCLNMDVSNMGGFSFNTVSLQLAVLVKFTLVTLLFVIFGSRIAKMLNKFYGGGSGFRFTNGG